MKKKLFMLVISAVCLTFLLRVRATVYVPPPVGGEATPINIPTSKPELQFPWIWLSAIILPLVATLVFVKLKKGK